MPGVGRIRRPFLPLLPDCPVELLRRVEGVLLPKEILPPLVRDLDCELPEVDGREFPPNDLDGVCDVERDELVDGLLVVGLRPEVLVDLCEFDREFFPNEDERLGCELDRDLFPNEEDRLDCVGCFVTGLRDWVERDEEDRLLLLDCLPDDLRELFPLLLFF